MLWRGCVSRAKVGVRILSPWPFAKRTEGGLVVTGPALLGIEVEGMSGSP